MPGPPAHQPQRALVVKPATVLWLQENAAKQAIIAPLVTVSEKFVLHVKLVSV